MSIVFTQYLRPDGRRLQTEITRSEEVETLAFCLAALGVRFESEVLARTGEVSLEAIRDDPNDPGELESLAAEICPNGPAVGDAVDKLIRDAWAKCQVVRG